MACSDSVPLFGYRRRSYLVLSGLLGALSWSLMATFVDSKYSAAFCILLGSFSVAFSDVVSVSYLVIGIYFFMESFNYAGVLPILLYFLYLIYLCISRYLMEHKGYE